MGVGRKWRKKPARRPRKTSTEKARRKNVQINRLVKLGFSEEKITKLSSWHIRDILKKVAKKTTREAILKKHGVKAE